MAEIREVKVPDIGDFDEVDVVEVLVESGTQVEAEQSLIVIESEKASLEVPAPFAGVVREVRVSVGDKVGEGTVIVTIEPGTEDGKGDAAERPKQEKRKEAAPRAEKKDQPAKREKQARPPEEEKEQEAEQEKEGKRKAESTEESAEAAAEAPGEEDEGAPAPRQPPASLPEPEDKVEVPHASPAVRRIATEFGVDLTRVEGTGPHERVLKDDVQRYVRRAVSQAQAEAGTGIPPIPAVDFTRFGEVEYQPLTRINRLAARNLQRTWLNLPQVTHFDEADITELEEFRHEHAEDAADKGFKLTFLAFVLKACAATLRAFPRFNSSLDPSGEQIVIKKYFHIGVAVDTEDGLVVPVLRNVDRHGVMDLARLLAEVSERARAGKLTPGDMQGGSFSVSSLGGIGGTGFTPIVNAPEVAILAVSRAERRPVYRDGELEPRLILPIGLTYDHRVIDGAAAARFMVHLKEVLSDFRVALL